MTESISEPQDSQAPAGEQGRADSIGAKLEDISKPFEAPIPGPSPAGENARFDERHEAIRNEVDKLGRPEGDELDWGLIEVAGREILTEKSKDYSIATYFGVAAYVLGGPRGLVEGISAISALLEHYWDTGFPPPDRLRARINAIDWFVDRVGAFGDRAPKTVQRDDFQLLSQAAKKLQDLVLERFRDDTPNIYGLNETLERIQLSIAASSDGEPQSVHAVASAPSAVTAPESSPRQQPVLSASAASLPTATVVSPQPSGGSVEARLAELTQPFVLPIPGVAKAGENVRNAGTHQAIRNEVDKLGKPSAEEVDWSLVRDAGRELLTTQSKDFLIASYFGVASYVQGGIAGLVTGLVALSAMLRDYWDDGFPPPNRARARVNAIDWFIDRVESMADVAPKVAAAGDLQMLSLAAKQFEALVLDRFQEESPNISRLKETLQRIELAIANEAPAPPGGGAQSAHPGGPPGDVPRRDQPGAAAIVQLEKSTAELTDPAEVNKFLRELGESVHKASRALFKASKEDPLAYRLCRQGLYMSFQQTPPATDGKITMVPPPPPDRAAHLAALLSTQNWPVLLDEAESGLASARLWLDQHRYVALALAGLGHETAKQTVVSEMAALIRRLPELSERAFSDGTPFASAPTREWLGSVCGSSTGSAMRVGTADGAEPGAFEDGLVEAHKLALDGKLREAVERLSGVIGSEAKSGRDRFRGKLAMAKACLAAGSPALADGILAGLCNEIRRFRLEEWEPKMAEACYRSRYEALAGMAGESAKSRDELADVYRQLCGVAPAEALTLGKPPS
jgi:type VI secretion system protein VasJ